MFRTLKELTVADFKGMERDTIAHVLSLCPERESVASVMEKATRLAKNNQI